MVSTVSNESVLAAATFTCGFTELPTPVPIHLGEPRVKFWDKSTFFSMKCQ